MGYGTDGLTFNVLRRANLARLPMYRGAQGRPAHAKPDGSDWSASEWLEATVGELGEYANLWKKIRRGDFGVTAQQVIQARDTARQLPGSGSEEAERIKKLVADELADVVIYLDLLAHRLGIDLGAAVMRKWNATSRKVGAPIRLDADDWHRCEAWSTPELTVAMGDPGEA